MNTLFAAGLFDSPWLLAVIVIGGALAKWLAKRRQEKEAGEQPEVEPSLPDNPLGELTLEDALRRLLGQESSSQQPAPPPIIPSTVPTGPSSTTDWHVEEYGKRGQNWMEEIPENRAEVRETTAQMPPLLRPTPFAQARAAASIISPSEELLPAVGHLEKLSESGQRPATVVHGVARHLRQSARAAYWRNPRNAREAFVASLVFGPPKGMEV
jgi:hypothetical protein